MINFFLMSNGWYFHDIKVKFIIFIYKSQYIFNVDCLISGLLISLYWIIPSYFEACSYTWHFESSSFFSFFLHSKTFQMCCVYCLLPLFNHCFILQIGCQCHFPSCVHIVKYMRHSSDSLLKLFNRIWQNWSHLPL